MFLGYCAPFYKSIESTFHFEFLRTNVFISHCSKFKNLSVGNQIFKNDVTYSIPKLSSFDFISKNSCGTVILFPQSKTYLENNQT